MVKYFSFQYILFLLIFIPALAFPQTSAIKGSVTDGKTGDPIPFVNIGLKDQNIGTSSDVNGLYRLDVSQGDFTVIFSSVGYEKQMLNVKIEAGKTQILNVALKSESIDLKTIVVSTSKYEQKIQESITTIDVLKPSLIENTNAHSIDKAIEQVPGVTIMDNEPQIRGGSGFSSGLGSRVMVLVDEIPLLRGDAGRPVWDFMPVDDVEQVEVVKGASSVIYGSSALNGAINVRTNWPADTSVTTAKIFTGVYSKPSRRYATSWSGMNPVTYGANFLHSRKINRFDLVIGGSYFNDDGYIGPTLGKLRTDSVSPNSKEYSRRLKLNFNTRFRPKKVTGLMAGLNGNFMISRSAESFFWGDADTNIYRAYPGSTSIFKDFLFYLDPFIKYYDKNGGVHSLKNRYFYTQGDPQSTQSSQSQSLFNEYEYTQKFKNLGDLMVVAGVMNIYSRSEGRVFSGVLNPLDSTTTSGATGMHFSDNLAGYAQIEKKVFNRMHILLGFRWEYYKIGQLEENKPVFRAGWNWRMSKGTFVRASFGQGYRFPSIGERYITTTSGSFGFYPNPDLRSESSWNSEVGIKQLFKFRDFVGFIDLAGFWQEYSDYTEFNFGSWGKNSDPSKIFGFKFYNTGDARIMGLDFSLAANGKISRNIVLDIMGGYTYNLPQSTQPDLVYYKNYNFQGSYNTSSSDPSDRILKYRIQHLGKLDFQLTYKRFSFGGSSRYYSFIRNIDKFFTDLDENGLFKSGITQYRLDHHRGTLLFDGRISYTLGSLKFSVVMTNILNTEFSMRPCTIEAPRLTTVMLVYSI